MNLALLQTVKESPPFMNPQVKRTEQEETRQTGKQVTISVILFAQLMDIGAMHEAGSIASITKDKPKATLLMDATNEEIRTALKRRHLVDKTHHYILIDPSLLRFVCPTGALLPYSISCTSGVRKAESIPLHDDECKQYLGYFPGDPDQDTQTKLLQCAKGPNFDTSGQGYTDLGRADGGYGTCTVIGDSRQE